MLSSRDIIEEHNNGNIIIEPFDINSLNINSYDVRLGNWFVHVTWNDGELQYGPPIYREDGETISIPVGGTLLGMTKEFVGTQLNIVAELRAKSSTRRMGITVCDDAGFGDVGYKSKWTCEFTGHIFQTTLPHDHRPVLTVGERFAQMVFFFTDTPPLKEYEGQYNSNDWPANMIPTKYREAWKKKYL